LFSACPLFAQDASQAEDQKAIQTTIEGYVKAFNSQDANKLVSYWADKGNYVDVRGQMTKGRENIQSQYDTFFKAFGKPTMTINVTSLDFANDDTVIEDGVREIQFPDNQPTREMRYTAVHVKKDGKWLVQSVRDAVVFNETNYKYLQGLEWMVGDWLDEEDGGVAIQTSCDWSPNRNYLIRTFTTMVNGEETLGGTQWIGWDAAKGNIRSWLFDSDGGYGEGVWTPEGDKWNVEANSVLPNGKLVKETHVITFLDQDKMSLATTNRTLDGQALPDDKVIVARREGSSNKDIPVVKKAAAE
jgi:uncharacterized protein (TIGR02246 family)